MKKRKSKESDVQHQDVGNNRKIVGSKREQRGADPAHTPFESPVERRVLCGERLAFSRRQHELCLGPDHIRTAQAGPISRDSANAAQYALLMRFFVATQSLLAVRSRGELFEIIHEIIANLIGCEEFGIFRFDDHCTLSLVSSHGIDTERLKRIPLGSSLIGRIALKGEPYFAGDVPLPCRLPHESHLNACIPLKAHEQLFGAIGLFGLLPQKGALQAEDKELLVLVGKLGAIVLSSSPPLCHAAIGAKA